MKVISTFFKNRKFRSKLLISYIIVGIIPILVLGIRSYSQASCNKG